MKLSKFREDNRTNIGNPQNPPAKAIENPTPHPLLFFLGTHKWAFG
jgi:hypothetical protein